MNTPKPGDIIEVVSLDVYDNIAYEWLGKVVSVGARDLFIERTKDYGIVHVLQPCKYRILEGKEREEAEFFYNVKGYFPE